MDRPGIGAKLNEAVNLVCKAPAWDSGLISCLWEKVIIDGQHNLIIGDQGTFQNGVHAPVEGISLVSDGFQAGECGVNIRKLKPGHFGRWGCTLFTHFGRNLTGEVRIFNGNQN